jgi:hypothetical protein
MTKKSGVELLEEMYETVATFDRRLQNVENILKELLDASNRRPVIQEAAVQPGLPPGLMVNSKPAQTPEQTNAPPTRRPSIEGAAPEPPAIKVSPNIKVMGKIRHDGKGLPDVSVTIHDSRNHAVKKTKTNRAGHWMAFLPPGKYAAECVLEGKVNGNVVFTVQPGDSAVSVGQPQ